MAAASASKGRAGRRTPARHGAESPSWLARCLAPCRDWLGRLWPRPEPGRTKAAVTDAAATGVVSALLERTIDKLDGC